MTPFEEQIKALQKRKLLPEDLSTVPETMRHIKNCRDSVLSRCVMKASWELDAEDGLAKLTLTMINVPVEITGEAKIVKPCVP